MKKKGMLLWKFSRELLGAAILILTFLGVSYSYGSGEAILKIRTAKDIGLMIEEMYLTPNGINTYIGYPEETSKLDISIKNYTVTVSSTANDATVGVYSFVKSLNYPSLAQIIEKPKKLYIGKINGEIIISDKKPDLRELKCPKIKTKPEIKNILIDSGIDETNNIEKAKIANSLAFSLISKLNKDYQVEHARNDNIYDLMDNPLSIVISKLDEKIEKADAIIKINIGEKKDNSNNIKIYFSPDSSKKEKINALGCSILNNLIENEELSDIKGIALIPKETEPILNNNKISMVIEIGNYLNKDTLDILKKANVIEKISSAIYNTIKNEETK